MLNKFILILLISLLPNVLLANDANINFCLDKQAAIDNNAISARNPTNPKIIKLIAIRTGLCDLLENKIIKLDFAIDLFNQMQESSIKDQKIEDFQNGKSESYDIISMAPFKALKPYSSSVRMSDALI